jgi:hypothetical protein
MTGFSKSTTDDMLKLDIRKLHKDGLLKQGLYYTSDWSRNGNPIGSISIKTEYDRICLIYRNRSGNAIEWENIETFVNITWTKCNYGGYRPWFLCPKCYRRVAILYGGKYFLCRHCHNLAYESQKASKEARPLDSYLCRIEKIKKRLKSSDYFPKRPKYMHKKNYSKLSYELFDLETKFESMAIGLLERNR